MKAKVYRSKISNKRFTRATFPRISKNEIRQPDGSAPDNMLTLPLERQSVVTTETAAVGFFGVKNLKEIAVIMKDDKDKFGNCLNKMISVYSDIIESEGGVIGKFKGNGAIFAFKAGGVPVKSIQTAIITCLKMRYLLNKLNRTWDMHRTPWKLSCSIDFGDVQFEVTPGSGSGGTSISGKSAAITRGIGISSGTDQILAADTLFMRFPFLETAFDVKKAFHVPVHGQEFLYKVREVVGATGPQAKKIYEDFV